MYRMDRIKREPPKILEILIILFILFACLYI
jgi:hypothetical protein